MLHTQTLRRSTLSLRALLRPGAIAAAMFLLMHAELLLRSSPLAPALMAAALAAGEFAAVPVAGCLLGLLRLPLARISLLPAISCTLVLAAELALSLLPRPPKLCPEARTGLIAGTAVLLPPLIAAGGNVPESLQALCCGALAAASAPFFLAALNLRALPAASPERTGLILAAGACIAGLWPLSPAAAEFLCALTVLISGSTTAASLAGLALAGGGAGLLKTASLVLCALAGGADFFRQRWQKLLAFLSAAALCRLLAGSDALSPLWAMCAGAVWLLIPESLAEHILRIFRPCSDTAPDAEAIARDLSAGFRSRLNALAEAFHVMAEDCTAPTEVPDEQELILQMRTRLCAGCMGYESCWAGSDNRGVQLLCRLIGDALDRVDAPPGMRTLFSDGEIPPDILRCCRRGRMIPDRLGLLLRDFGEKRRSEIKRCANNQLLSLQLTQAGQILQDLARAQNPPTSLNRLQAALKQAGLGGCTAMMRGDGILLVRNASAWNREEVQRACNALGRSQGGQWLPRRESDGLRFVRAPRLSAQLGACCQSGVAGQPSGDSHLTRMLDEGRLMIAISDGMGSGSAASAESLRALTLLRCFLDAGISRTLALETLNRQLLMGTSGDMFATLDLCIVDLNSGIAEFSKLAACRTLLLRGRELLRVEGGHLPLGILENVQPGLSRIRLRPGDLLVMGSDGVMEAGDALLAERLTREHASDEPRQLAEQLVRAAAMQSSPADDRTCICMRIQGS